MTGSSEGTGIQLGGEAGLVSSGERTGPEVWEGDTRRLSEGDFPSTTQRNRGKRLFPSWAAMCPGPSSVSAQSQTCCTSYILF